VNIAYVQARGGSKRFPWAEYVLANACDINTPEDLELAKIKAGL